MRKPSEPNNELYSVRGINSMKTSSRALSTMIIRFMHTPIIMEGRPFRLVTSHPDNVNKYYPMF